MNSHTRKYMDAHPLIVVGFIHQYVDPNNGMAFGFNRLFEIPTGRTCGQVGDLYYQLPKDTLVMTGPEGIMNVLIPCGTFVIDQIIPILGGMLIPPRTYRH